MKIQSINPAEQQAFSGRSVHILDGGAHGSYIKHFAEATIKDLGADVEIKFHNAVTNPRVESVKQLADLEAQIRYLNLSEQIKKGDFVTIPGMTAVSLLNLSDRIGCVLKESVKLTSDNVKANKDKIMRFLNNLYYNRYTNSDQIKYMDNLQQGMENTYGVIQELDKLTQKGVNVYIPAGHPDDNSIKWMTAQKNQKEELYKAIASGCKEFSPEVKRIIKDIRNKGWYDLNLLALANAHIVNVKDKEGEDYLFASRDGFANDGARGVYNFTPIRDGWSNIKGYSFRNETTVEFPYEEFPDNAKIANINKFVGLPINSVLADENDHKKYRELVLKKKSTAELPDKLYRIADVFDESEIKRRKLNYLGDFISKDQKLVFDVNPKGKVLFQKCNCEGSDRPSVKSMWGCCFSTVSAIRRDIRKAMQRKEIDMQELPLSQKINMTAIMTFALAQAMLFGIFKRKR